MYLEFTRDIVANERRNIGIECGARYEQGELLVQQRQRALLVV